VYIKMENNVKALEYLEKALEMAQERAAGDASPHEHLIRGNIEALKKRMRGTPGQRLNE
jgi:hypothetical protein